MTGPGAARVLADKRHQGAVVYGEVTPAALVMDGTECAKGSWNHGAAFVVSPPLRPEPETPEILMDLLSRWIVNSIFGMEKSGGFCLNMNLKLTAIIYIFVVTICS